MALVLARLRLALAFDGARLRRGGVALLALSWLFGLAMGIGGGLAADYLRAMQGGTGLFWVMGLYSMVFVAWVLQPVVLPTGLSDPMNPAVLEQYPLSRTQQITGLLLGGLATPGAVGTFLFAAAPAVATQPGVDVWSRIAALVGAALFTVMCVAASSAVRTVLTTALSSRVGQEIAVAAVTVIVIAYYVGGHFLSTLIEDTRNVGQTVFLVASWTPGGSGALVPYLIAIDAWPDAAGRALVLIGVVALSLLVWAWALHRYVLGSTQESRRARDTKTTARALALVPPLFSRLPVSAGLAAMSQQLRYFFFRAPKEVQALIIGPVIGCFMGIFLGGNYGLAVIAAFATAMMTLTNAVDIFGYDDGGVELTLQTGAPLSSVLRGKIAALAVVLAPLTVVVTVVSGIITQKVADVPVALLAAFAALALGMTIGVLTSALNPYSPAHPQGDRGRIGMVSFGSLMGGFALVAGFSWAIAQIPAVVPLWASLSVALILALGAFLVAAAFAGRSLERNPERLLTAFTVST